MSGGWVLVRVIHLLPFVGSPAIVWLGGSLAHCGGWAGGRA